MDQMADVINLRLARKARQRTAAEALAASNRAKFGQPKAVRKARKQEFERAAKLLDGARREID
jgi:hypothetical protein